MISDPVRFIRNYAHLRCKTELISARRASQSTVIHSTRLEAKVRQRSRQTTELFSAINDSLRSVIVTGKGEPNEKQEEARDQLPR